MNRERTLLVQRLEVINRLTGHVHHTALNLLANRHCDWTARHAYIHAATQAGGQVHRHATYHVLTNMLLNLNYEAATVITGNLQCLMD